MIKNWMLYSLWLLLATTNVVVISYHTTPSAMVVCLCIGVLLAAAMEAESPTEAGDLHLGFVVSFIFGAFVFLNFLLGWNLVEKVSGEYAKELHMVILIPLSYFSTLLTASIIKFSSLHRQISVG